MPTGDRVLTLGSQVASRMHLRRLPPSQRPQYEWMVSSYHGLPGGFRRWRVTREMNA